MRHHWSIICHMITKNVCQKWYILPSIVLILILWWSVCNFIHKVYCLIWNDVLFTEFQCEFYCIYMFLAYFWHIFISKIEFWKPTLPHVTGHTIKTLRQMHSFTNNSEWIVVCEHFKVLFVKISEKITIWQAKMWEFLSLEMEKWAIFDHFCLIYLTSFYLPTIAVCDWKGTFRPQSLYQSEPSPIFRYYRISQKSSSKLVFFYNFSTSVSLFMAWLKVLMICIYFYATCYTKNEFLS